MRFSYTAQDKEGNKLKGEMQADTERAAAKMIAQRGLLVLQISPISSAGEKDGKKSRFSAQIGGGSLNTFDQIIIARQLGTVLSTGTDLLAGLSIIAQDAIKPLVRRILLDVRSRISAGESLAQALSAWKDEFSPVMLNLIRAAEMSGNLANVLTDFSKELRKDYNFNRKVKGAMMYPAILIFSLFLMLIVVMWVVIPKLKELFASTNAEIPVYTRMIFGLSDLWIAYWWAFISIFGAIIITFAVMLRKTKTRNQLKTILWHLPYLRTIQRNYALLRLTKTLSTLLRAGIPLERALISTGDAVGGKYNKTLAEISDKSLTRGISLADSMRKHPDMFPGLLVSVVATGEKSGQLDNTLIQMSEYYEEEVMYALDRFLVIIEPLLIIIVGLIIGLIAGSLISPIYNFIGRF